MHRKECLLARWAPFLLWCHKSKLAYNNTYHAHFLIFHLDLLYFTKINSRWEVGIWVSKPHIKGLFSSFQNSRNECYNLKLCLLKICCLLVNQIFNCQLFYTWQALNWQKGILMKKETSNDNITGNDRERFMIKIKKFEKCFFFV